MSNFNLLWFVGRLTLRIIFASFFVSAPTISDWAAIATAVGTIALAIVAVFQDTIRFWLWKPKLKLSVRAAPPDCQKTIYNLPGGLPVFCYYFRICIANYGNTEAREVEVFAASLCRRNEDGTYSPVKTFTPMNLLWSHFREPFLKVLSPEIPKFCDLAHTVFPNARGKLGHTVDGVAPNKAVLAFDLQVEPNMKGHLVGPGTYLLKLIGAAANARPVPHEIEITFSGTWHDEEDKMLNDGFRMKVI